MYPKWVDRDTCNELNITVTQMENPVGIFLHHTSNKNAPKLKENLTKMNYRKIETNKKGMQTSRASGGLSSSTLHLCSSFP